MTARQMPVWMTLPQTLTMRTMRTMRMMTTGEGRLQPGIRPGTSLPSSPARPPTTRVAPTTSARGNRMCHQVAYHPACRAGRGERACRFSLPQNACLKFLYILLRVFVPVLVRDAMALDWGDSEEEDASCALPSNWYVRASSILLKFERTTKTRGTATESWLPGCLDA